jgi:hypothetical protein
VIRLLFGGVNQINDQTVGPHRAYRISENFIRDLGSGKVLAHYRNHHWQIGEDHFSRYDCLEPTCIHFETSDGLSSATFGPFQKLFVADGTLYADENLFAKFIDETLNWHSYELETYWPVLVISSLGDGPP